jgi:hypothetical protein
MCLVTKVYKAILPVDTIKIFHQCINFIQASLLLITLEIIKTKRKKWIKLNVPIILSGVDQKL